VQREILDAAWSEMTREGVAALNVREVARAVGLRQQSLTYYFPTKQALLDALFADGFAALRRRFDDMQAAADPVQGVVDIAVVFVQHLVARPAAYHLMFQRTVPGFEPSEDSHAIALTVLRELVDRLAAAGITQPADLALVRSVMSGIAAEQIANDPHGRLFVDQTERGVRAVLAAITADTPGDRPGRTGRAAGRAAPSDLSPADRDADEPPHLRRFAPGSGRLGHQQDR
jgi:AcrR family transcriptional regulator